MKQITLILLLALGFSAHAIESTDCLVYSLKADHQFVSKQQSQLMYKDLLKEGKKFGFKTVSIVSESSMTSYSFNYKRDKVINSTDLKNSFEELMTQVYFHVNSRIDYSISCEIEAPTPLPRISGTN